MFPLPLQDVEVTFELESGRVVWWEAEMTGIVPVATIQGIPATGYFMYTVRYGYSQETASIVFSQEGTLQGTRLSDRMGIGEETQWRMSARDLDGESESKAPGVTHIYSNVINKTGPWHIRSMTRQKPHVHVKGTGWHMTPAPYKMRLHRTFTVYQDRRQFSHTDSPSWKDV